MSRNPDNAAIREAGFTLLEVVIALAIAAMALGAVVASTGLGLNNVTAANLYIEATRRAQDRLDRIGVEGPPAAGDRSGNDGGGYTWRTVIVPISKRPSLSGNPQESFSLYQVVVTIGWRYAGTSRGVTVQSERFGRLIQQ